MSAYLDHAGRERFHDEMDARVAEGICHWVSNEAPQVLPRLGATVPAHPGDLDGFLLAVDGRAVARTHPHGRRLDWFDPA